MQVVKGYVHVAEALAAGNPHAFGPLVLGHLYRGINNVVDKGMDPLKAGPIWILQLWLHAYFPELRSPYSDALSASLPGERAILNGLREHSAKDCFKFFYTTKDREPNSFVQLMTDPICPRWLEVARNPDPGLPKNCPPMKIISNVWSSILLCRDLPFGKRFQANQCGVEVYCPNLVARQFGLCQGVPVPWTSSYNKYSRK